MKKLLLCILLFVLINENRAQQPVSPESFLGYNLGTAFTPHYKIVEYCKAIANAKPGMVKLVSYGKTYEGRELLLLFVSSPENIKNLDAIKANNQRLSGIAKDKVAPQITNAPAIVWLSYNVHGNEASSSEVSMKTLYSLASDSMPQIKEWLQNTVVVIDPCLNPDGRERYVNWYNGMRGITPNPDLQSREHNEPWPGGRSNHYNFDLNRDWAWQTQIETQQRLAQYNQWLPQVHVDFHEQYINNPYYFAPGAEPVHEVITTWQKDFQTVVGKNNAKYFDNNGWLYFTRQEFDLFYPSYGDTYPLYNGSIGMTYEQAGHSRGGLAAAIASGDTLTLADRIAHHYTTSLATIETASKNAAKLLTEYKQYFEDNRAGKDANYKAYVVTSNDTDKILGLKKLLDNNLIQYGATSGNVKGFNYTTGKEENNATLLQYSLVVPAAQTKGSLVKVLFDPGNKLNDSVTYDITAWALPYVYGLQGYALKEARTIGAWNYQPTVNNTTSNYGYLISYTSLQSVQFLSELLNKNMRVRYAEKPFTYSGKRYKPGTLILLKANNGNNFEAIIRAAANKYSLPLIAVNGGFMDTGADFGSPDVKLIKAPKVALVTGPQVSSTAAGEVWHLFDQTLHYPITLLNAEDLGGVNLSVYTTLILPDGYYEIFNDKNTNEKLKAFVRSGGKIVALENTLSAMASTDWGIKVKEEAKEDSTGDYANLKVYADRNKDGATKSIAGAIYRVDVDSTHPLAFGYDDYFTLKLSDKVFSFFKDGWNVGYIKKSNYRMGFAGNKLKKQIVDGLVFGEQPMGNGSVIYFADNPLFRLFWKNGELLFCNSIFLAGMN